MVRDELLMIECEMVLMPYNYIMDKFIRSKLPFDLKESVVIIDEAHNIVSIHFLLNLGFLLLGKHVDRSDIESSAPYSDRDKRTPSSQRCSS